MGEISNVRRGRTSRFLIESLDKTVAVAGFAQSEQTSHGFHRLGTTETAIL
jgi:hypothetical protein